MFKSELLTILNERGFIHQATHLEDLDDLCSRQSIKGYWGCDATAASLHIGNLMGMMVMRWMQETGHTPILLVGGGTTKIGDPSGRDTNRQLLTQEKIDSNILGIQKSYEKVISFQNSILVNNADWLDKLEYIPFLRDIGVFFSVNRLLSLESIKSRLDRDQSLSFIEFNYPILQAYDFLELYRNHGCVLQVGGSEQWGNIVGGVDLVRRVSGGGAAYGLTWPLLAMASGAKMGKSANGAVWLDETLLSPYEYWQFWRNVEDTDVFRFLKIYTMLPLNELEQFSNLQGQDLIQAKIFLADQATSFLHGSNVLSAIHETSRQAFAGGEISAASVDQLPHFVIQPEFLHDGVSILSILESMGFITSKREGRQKIREGAVTLCREIVSNELYKVGKKDFDDNEILKISVGAKKHGLIIKI